MQAGVKYPAHPLSREQVGQLLDACSKRAPTGVRNRALIVLMQRCGLRIGEAIALRASDLDVEAGTLRVLHGKGDKARTLGIPRSALPYLLHWQATRKGLGLTGRQPLLCSLKGTPLQHAYVNSLLRRLARRAGIDRRVHAHALRHSFAVDLARKGTSIVVIQAALGHASLLTTQRYVSHLMPTEVIDVMQDS
jgi:integrase/recombinase XerD